MTLRIQTARLVLRRFTRDDAQDLLGVVSDPSVARVIPEIEVSMEGVLNYIDMQNARKPFQLDTWFDLAIERKLDRVVTGLLSMVHKAHHQGQIGWALGVGYRGCGFVTEAASALIEYGFDRYGMHRISADTTSANPDSWKVMERLGMRCEAQLREAEFRDGEWIDYYVYGVLAAEWKQG
jgi:RimJ/RimL family protein N-acetyltransferase